MFHALCIWLANKDSAEVNSLTVNPFPPNKQAGQLDKCNCSFLLLLCQDLPTPPPPQPISSSLRGLCSSSYAAKKTR